MFISFDFRRVALIVLLGCIESCAVDEDSAQTGKSSNGHDLCELLNQPSVCSEEVFDDAAVVRNIAACRQASPVTVTHIRPIVLDEMEDCLADLTCEYWSERKKWCTSVAILKNTDGLITHNVPDVCFLIPHSCEDIKGEFQYYGIVDGCDRARHTCADMVEPTACLSLVAFDPEYREKVAACWAEPIDCDEWGYCLQIMGVFSW